MSDMLPCPFCGSDEIFRSETRALIECQQCLARHDDLDRWNTRTISPAIQQAVEALQFYADPFAWKKLHDPDDNVRVPDFYSETSFGDTAQEALGALQQQTAASEGSPK